MKEVDYHVLSTMRNSERRPRGVLQDVRGAHRRAAVIAELRCLSILNPTFFAEHPNCPDGGPVSLHFLYSVRRVRVSLRPMRRFVGSGDLDMSVKSSQNTPVSIMRGRLSRSMFE